MAFIPKIPKMGHFDGPGALPQSPAPEPDLRLRVERDEVLAGIDHEGKLYHLWGRDFAVGPGNLRYSQETLFALEVEGVVTAYVDGKKWVFTDFVEERKEIENMEDSYDNEGNVGNTPTTTLEWRRSDKPA